MKLILCLEDDTVVEEWDLIGWNFNKPVARQILALELFSAIKNEGGVDK